MRLKQVLLNLLSDGSEKTDPRLQDPQKIKDRPINVDPIERIVKLKESGLDLTVELFRTTGVGRGVAQKHWHINEIDPLEFYSQVSEALGGGTYRMSFRYSNGSLYKLQGLNEEETHVFTVAGKPKLTGEKEAKEEKATNPIEWLNKIMAEGSGVALLLKLFMDSRDKSSEMVMKMFEAQLGNGNGKIDSSAMLANVTDTLVKLKEAAGDGGVDPMDYISKFMVMFNSFSQQMRPPVATTGSNSSGLDKFFESLGAAAPALVPMIAGAMGNRGEPAATAAEIPENTVSPPAVGGTTSASEAAREAFAGSGASIGETASDPSRPPQKFNPLNAFKTPDLGGQSELTPQSAAFGSVMKLRYMIEQKADPEDIAVEMIDSINLLRGATRVDGEWENFIADPGEAFDQFAPLIGEWTEHPQYKTDCRSAMIKAITDYFEGDGEERSGEPQIVEQAQATVGPPTTGETEEESQATDESEVIDVGPPTAGETEEPAIENDDTPVQTEPSGEREEPVTAPKHDTVKSPV